MSRLRRLSGDEVIRLLGRCGFAVHSQRGSYVKLRRITASGTVQTFTTPRHGQRDTGTLRAVIRHACRFVPKDELRREFYTVWPVVRRQPREGWPATSMKGALCFFGGTKSSCSACTGVAPPGATAAWRLPCSSWAWRLGVE